MKKSGRNLTKKILFCLLCLFVFSSVCAGKKLISWSRGCPDTDFIRDNIEDMEKAPFDGIVFFLTSDSSKKGASDIRPVLNVPEPIGDFSWHCWGTRIFTKEEMQRDVGNLRSTNFKKFTDNFLRFNVTPGDVDWFDSFDAILNNARVAGWVAKQGGVKGIMFDIETYYSQIWDYKKQKYATTKTFEEYCTQVHKRGVEVMEAFQAEYPDITIIFTFGYSFLCTRMSYPDPYVEGPNSYSMTSNNPDKLRFVQYGLLASFLDGMTAAANEDVRLVDGGEFTYFHRTAEEFMDARKQFTDRCLPFVADKDKYRKVFRQAFATWMDFQWRQPGGWKTKDFTNNYWQPADLRKALINALECTDEYVWLYDEWQRWWEYGGGLKVPRAYFGNVKKAHESCTDANSVIRQ
ncbi:MAG: hypothetical protein ABIG61_15550 [Planctomycetota bacterium]